MKTAALIVLITLAVSAVEPVHLGTITPKDGILLASNTRLTNWVCFAVELVSHSSTNTLAFHTTNSILTLPRLAGLPEGLTTLRVKNVCNDKIHSDTLVYTIVIQHGVTPTPRAAIIRLPPPLPGEPVEAALPAKPLPLPDGTNVSYAEGLEMKEFHKRSRRSSP